MVISYKPFLGQLGVTYPQYLVLLVLWEDDNIPLKALGQRLHLDSGTLTPMIKRMINLGILDKTRSEHDEREIRISLTKAGRALKEQIGIPEKLACEFQLEQKEIDGLKKRLRDLLQRMEDL